ncbi:helix-turn-helix domain-containing protein [Methylorubrum sp. POS3]|uniref:helix-turn-helix domain-containing protein n=1 Tax=Methylorubrum sp. POS3 TaxID=2998492 RepID=UPI0037266578
MDGLRRRFGTQVAAFRRRRGLTQDGLAAAAELSVDMISKIERGSTGVHFPVIERLAAALDVDPGELFLAPGGVSAREGGPLTELAQSLAPLSDAELRWVKGILDAILKPRT